MTITTSTLLGRLATVPLLLAAAAPLAAAPTEPATNLLMVLCEDGTYEPETWVETDDTRPEVGWEVEGARFGFAGDPAPLFFPPYPTTERYAALPHPRVKSITEIASDTLRAEVFAAWEAEAGELAFIRGSYCPALLRFFLGQGWTLENVELLPHGRDAGFDEAGRRWVNDGVKYLYLLQRVVAVSAF